MPRRHARQIEQLAALLDGTRAPEDVDPDTRRLGTLATAVIEHEPVEAVALSPANRAAMRARLLADIANEAPETTTETAPARRRVSHGGRSIRVGLATGLASALVGTTGVAFAAQEALPGDALYGIKQATESARLSLAGDVAQHGHLQLRFAEERLEEIVDGHDRLGSARLVTALAEMDQRSLAGAEALATEATRADDAQVLDALDAFTQRQADRLLAVYDELPPDVRPRAEDSLGVLRRIRLELLFPAIEACDCIEPATFGVTPLVRENTLGERLRSAALPTPTPALDLPALTDGLSDAAAEAVARVQRATGDGGLQTNDDAATTPDTPASAPERSTVTDTLDDVTGGVGDAVENTTEGLGNAVEDTTEGLGNAVEDTTDGLGDAVEDTADGVGDVIGGETGDAVDDVGEGVDDVVDDVGDTVGGVIEDPVGRVGEVAEDPVGEVGEAVEDVTDGLGGVVDGLSDGGLGLDGE